jgi:phage-related protein
MPGSSDTFISLAQGLEGNIKKATKEMQGFNDVSQKINGSFTKTNKELKTTEDVSRKVNDTFDDINKTKEKNNEATHKWNQALGSVKSTLKGIVGIFAMGMGALSFVDAIKGAFALHQNMTDLAYQMGHGAAGAKFLESSIMDITASTGMALEKVTAMTHALTEMKVPLSMMKQLTIDSTRFAEITGANADSVAQMTAGLVRMGGLGQKSISNIMGNMVQVQRAFGISAGEVNKLTNSITDTTMILRNMGKNAGEIEKFQKGTMKLAGAFASVGIEAGKAVDLVDRLLDPGRLEDNALLYSKLGISIEDAISGNIDPADIARGLQGIGSELKDMAGPQANALAKALGVPLQQLRQMGNMDMQQIQETFGGLTGSSESLAAAQKDQATAQRNMEQMWEKIKGTIGTIALKLMPIFDAVAEALNDNMGNILGWVRGIIDSGFVDKFVNGIAKGIQGIGGVLSKITSGIGKLFENLNPKVLLFGLVAIIAGIIMFRKKFASVATDSATDTRKAFYNSSKHIGEDISSGISAGLEMASEKGTKVFEAKMKAKSRLVSDDIQTRISEGHQAAALKSAAAYQKLLAGENTFGWAKKMNESTAEWLEKISAGGKPLSAFTSFYKSTQDAIKENMKMSQVDFDNRKNFLSTLAEEKEMRKSTLETRLADLNLAKTLSEKQKEGIITSDELNKLQELNSRGITNSAAQQRELNILSKEYKNVSDDIIKIKGDAQGGGELIALQEKQRYEQLKHIKTLHIDELALMAAQSEESKKSLEDAIKKSLERKTSLEIEQKALENVEKQLNAEQKLLSERMAKLKDGEKLSNEEMARYSEIRKALIENAALVSSVNEEHSIAESMLKEQNTELERQKALHDDINGVINERGQGDVGALVDESLFDRMGNALSGAMGVVKSDFTNLMGEVGKSVGNTFEAVKEKLNPKNWVAAIRTAGDGNLFKGILKMGAGAAKAMADGIGKAGKAAAQMFGGAGKALMAGGALLAGAFLKSDKGKEVMEKVQSKIAEVMAKIMPKISDLMDKLVPTIMNFMPVIMNLIDELVPVITDLIDELAPVIMDLISSLLPLVVSLLPAILPLFQTLIGLLPPLIKLLLPPLLKVLSLLLNILGVVVSVIGQMISGLGNFIPGLKKVGDDIQSIGKGLQTAASSMSRSADRMAGAALSLVDVMDEASRQTELNNKWSETSNKTAKVLQDTNIISITQAKEMSAKEIGMHFAEQSKRAELATALAENVTAIRDQIKTNIMGEKLEGVIKSATEIASQGAGLIANSAQRRSDLYQHAGDGRWGADDIQKFAREQVTTAQLEQIYLKGREGVSVEEIARLIGKNNDPKALENIAGLLDRWANKTMTFESDASFWRNLTTETSVVGSGRTSSVVNRERTPQEMIKMMQDAGMTLNQDLMLIIEKNGIKAIEAIRKNDAKTIGEMIEQNAAINTAATQEANNRTLKAFQERMITVGGGLEAMNKTREGRDALGQINRLRYEDISDAGAIAKMENTIFGLLTKANTLNEKELEALKDAQHSLRETAKNTDPSKDAESVVKLYPAIVEASSSGFVKTQEAEARTSGGSPEERTAAATEQQIKVLEDLYKSQGISAEGIQSLVEEFRKLREAQVAANVTRP